MLNTLIYELRRLWPLLVVIALALVVFGDGAQLAVQLYALSMVGLVLIVAHLIRKSLFPYVDLSFLVNQAKGEPLAAAVVFASIVALIVSLLFATSARAEVPERAKALLPILSAAVSEHWSNAPLSHIMAGQVEQESSWKQQATLKTSRELGRGLVQLTIAYKSDGSERFNSYRDAVRMRALAGWDWERDPYNIRYQLTYLVLRDRAEFAGMRPLFSNETETWKASLVCYNAGKGRVLKRRHFAKAQGLPVDQWDGGLAEAKDPTEAKLLYGRSLRELVNEYPRKVLTRAEKYRGAV